MSNPHQEDLDKAEIVQEPIGISRETSPINEKKEKITLTRTESFLGPIPPPEILLGYEQVLPGSADRILSMAEKEGEHRRQLERIIVKGDSNRAYLGLFLGFFIAIFGLGGSVYLGSNGKNWASGIMSAATLTGLVTVFVTGKERKKVDTETQD